MAEPLETSAAGLEAEEARLARAAAAGDGEAFATLYERYARRAYNLALRLCGSDQDAADAVQEAFLSVMRRLPEIGDARELAFGSYLFTATRNATYDLMRRQQRSQPSDSIPESAVPLGAGAGGLGLDPGDPGEDPDRKVLLEAQQEEIAAANARLPERQREALALRELEEMSYDEIAVTMGMNRNSVAQLISRARINLRDELRGTALASVAVSSPDCERALPLIAARDDRQLPPDSADATWLASHMSSCHTCQVASEAMQEAGVSYRAWIPVAVAPWLFKETMARAAELSGSDWSGVAGRRLERPTDPAGLPGLPTLYRAGPVPEKRPRRRRAALAGALAVLLLLAGAVVAISAGGGGEVDPEPARAEPAEATAAEPAPQPQPKPVKAKKKEKPEPRPEPATSEAAEPEPVPATEAPAAESASPTPAKSKSPPPQQSSGQTGVGGTDSVRQPAPQADPEPPVESAPEPVPPPAEEPTEPVPPRTPPNEPPVPGGPGRTPPR